MMNKLNSIFLCLLIFLGATNLQGQNHFGFKFGINSGKWAVGQEFLQGEDLKQSPGLNAGIFYQIKLNQNLSIQPELLLIQKGLLVSDPSYSQTFRMNYLEIPILLKTDFVLFDHLSFFSTAGPTIGYASTGKIIYEFNGERESEDLEIDDGYKRVEISLAFGAGVELKTETGKLVLDLRYLYGLTNLFDDSFNGDIRVSNRGLGLTIGYAISF